MSVGKVLTANVAAYEKKGTHTVKKTFALKNGWCVTCQYKTKTELLTCSCFGFFNFSLPVLYPPYFLNNSKKLFRQNINKCFVFMNTGTCPAWSCILDRFQFNKTLKIQVQGRNWKIPQKLEKRDDIQVAYQACQLRPWVHIWVSTRGVLCVITVITEQSLTKTIINKLIIEASY